MLIRHEIKLFYQNKRGEGGIWMQEDGKLQIPKASQGKIPVLFKMQSVKLKRKICTFLKVM
jgi:hypothetical protein